MAKKKRIKVNKEEPKRLQIRDIREELRKLEPTTVKLEQVYLDPNNPRLAIIKKEPVPFERVIEEGVQRDILETLKNDPKMEIKNLMESIATTGFSSINRVVLKSFDKDRYIVVEGNRRIAALKILLDQHKSGRRTLPEDIVKGILEFEALIYRGTNPDISWIIQGFGHTPGIIPWEKVPTAKFYGDIERIGLTPDKIEGIFGLTKREVNKLIRSYYGYRQAEEDEDWGREVEPGHFGYFNEIIFVKSELKDWLGWDDNERRFKNNKTFKQFLQLMCSKTKEGKNIIDISPTTRKYLPLLVTEPQYKDLFEELLEGDTTIHNCAVRIEERRKLPPPPPPLEPGQILANLKEMKNQIIRLPTGMIKSLEKTEEEREQKREILNLLNELVELLKIQIQLLTG